MLVRGGSEKNDGEGYQLGEGKKVYVPGHSGSIKDRLLIR